METVKKLRMAEPIQGFRLPRYREIPDVGLYLEQVTRYINGYLAPLGCMDITPSMVSNYAKQGLIPKPVKKQYYTEHVAYLLFVAVAKNLMSMEHIGQLIQMQRGTYGLPVAYDYFCCQLENALFYRFGLQDQLQELGKTASFEKDMLSSLLIAAANVIYLHACLSDA